MPASSNIGGVTTGTLIINSITALHFFNANVFLGYQAGNYTMSTGATGNVGVGGITLQGLTSGLNNCAFGEASQNDCTSGSYNSSLGFYSLAYNSTGSYNTAFGEGTFVATDLSTGMLTGSYNTAIGYKASSAYRGAESSNICISAPGVAAESNVLRIGQSGSGSGQQNKAYIAGIYNKSVGASNGLVFNDSTDLCGSSWGTNGQIPISATAGSVAWANLTSTGSTITITNGANTINLEAAGGSGASTFNTGSGTATASGGAITLAGSTYIATTGSGSTATFTLTGTIPYSNGGTGQSSWTKGDLLYASATNTISKLAIGSTGQTLTVAAGLPSWASGGGGGITTLDAGSGSATGSTVTIAGDGANISTSATSATLTVTMSATPTFTSVTTSTGNIVTGEGLDLPAVTGSGTTGAITVEGGNYWMWEYPSFTSDPSLYLGGAGNIAGVYGNTQRNIAIGKGALNNGSLLRAKRNIVIGAGSGTAITTDGTDNIIIGDAVAGFGSATVGVIQLGNTSTATACYIAGGYGVTVTGSALLMNSSGQIGTVVSSMRFKDNITDMGDTSSPVMKLRPVNFNRIGDITKTQQYGLIAEEVATVFPDLVLYGRDGAPDSVKYHDLPAILLNELIKMSKRVQNLEYLLLEGKKHGQSE